MTDKNRTFEDEVERIIRIEIPHWKNGGTNFTSVLLHLIAKADTENRFRLKKVYPAEVEGWCRWEYNRWFESGKS